MVMFFPGFARRARGRADIVRGFQDFCDNAIVHRFDLSDMTADVQGGTGVASFAFDLVYEREGTGYRSTGRDLWVFAKQGNRWQAVWRTMLDVAEEPVALG